MLNVEQIQISKLNPADYNPRYLSSEALANLQDSIRTLGVIKPIIIRSEDYKILAGHQRSKASASMGAITMPAFILTGVNSSDEVRFNQLHNFCECEINERAPVLKVNHTFKLSEGYNVVPNSELEIVQSGEKNHFVNELSKMILRYGQFANAICDLRGCIFVSAVYAKAVKLLGLDLLVYAVPHDMIQTVSYYFGKEYGEFEYTHIEKKTYIQSLAQKFRLRTSENGEDSKGSKSTLYETQVLPFITKEMSILDFGAGQKDYAKMLDAKGFNIHAIEFFHRKPGKDSIWVDQIKRDFRQIENHLKTNGQYDVVVCDSVLNSVNSKDDERAVLVCLSALCKRGGMIFYSGIPLQFKEKTADRKNSSDHRGTGLFVDKNGFTGTFRYGEWYFQKYHTLEDIQFLNESYIGTHFNVYDGGHPMFKELQKSSFQVTAINEKPNTIEEVEWALNHEFSLPLPNGKHWELNEDIIKAYHLSEILTNRT